MFTQGDTTLFVMLIKNTSGDGLYTKAVQYTQPDTAGFYDPNQQQLCVPQQMQQKQQGTSVYSHKPQVQSQNNHTFDSVQQQYDTSFPPLTDTPKSPWQKVEYKKRPRDTPEKPSQNVMQIKLNGCWLKQPSPSNNNRFEALSGEENVE